MTSAAGSWASLSMYESTDLVKRFAKQRKGRSPNTAKAREISAHFAQGREYFRSASGAGELVRPLILYYGVLALARGAVIFLDQTKFQLESAHGLDASGWVDVLSKPRKLPEATVRIENGGTFPELARVTDNMERVRVPRPPVSRGSGCREPGHRASWKSWADVEGDPGPDPRRCGSLRENLR